MAESVLFKSYRATEKQRAEKSLDEALGRLEAASPVPAEPAALPSGQPAAQPATPPAEPAVRQPGVFESIKRGILAVPKRFNEGIDTIGGIIAPVTPAERGELPADASTAERILNHPVTRAVLGASSILFPFSAFAGETGGDVYEWLAESQGDLTDEKLRAARAHAEKFAPGTVPLYDTLLTVPYEERINRAREVGSLSGELLAGVLPGYTGR